MITVRLVGEVVSPSPNTNSALDALTGFSALLTPQPSFPDAPNPEGVPCALLAHARFWSKVDVPRGSPDLCWRWAGSLDEYGYGQIKTAAHTSPKRAHRVAYELAFGPIPEGLLLRHRCNHRACVNPSHLTPGTHAENMADMVAAGNVWKGGPRSKKGEKA